MPERRSMVALVGALVWIAATPARGGESQKAYDYPRAPGSETVDDYHGTKVADPFRPLEDPDSSATRAWVEAENRVTGTYLKSIPEREAIRRRLTELWDFEKYDPPFREGNRFFYTYNTGLQNQKILYTCESDDGEPKVLLNPNTLSADGTVALAGTSVSDDGRYLAYGLAGAGSDWTVWKVRDVSTCTDLTDQLKWIKFSSATWTPDSRGFYYGRFPEPKMGDDLKQANYHQKVYYHQLGNPQTLDRLVWEDPSHKEWRAGPRVTDDGKYLILVIEKGTDAKHRVFYQPLETPAARPIHLVGEFEAEYTFIDNDGPVFWFKTNKNAAHGKVIAIDTRDPNAEKWVDVIPEAPRTLQSVESVGDRLLAMYLEDAHTVVRVFRSDGTHIRDVDFPGLGTATGFHGKRKQHDTYYGFTSFTTPTTIYRYDVATGKSTVWRRPKLKFKPEDFETSQVFYASKDGTRVPMFLSHKKGLKRDARNPTLLYGYGGFNIPLTPTFTPAVLAWMEMGGLHAQPSLRGGGEYGEDWHQGGYEAQEAKRV